MLQSMKERMTGPTIWVIMLILIVPFAFFGVEQFAGGGADPTVVEVDGENITQSQFQRAYQQQYQQLAQMLGDNFRADMINNEAFRQQVLDQMIQERVLRRYADERGYSTSDTDLMEYLRQIPAFQDNGSFSPQTYRAMVSRVGQSTDQYEASLSNRLAIEQMRSGVLGSAFISDAEFGIDYRLRNQKRALRYARFPQSAYLAQAEVGDDEVHAYYDDNAPRYQAPERVKLAYVELDRDALPPAEKPAADVLKLIYDAEKNTRFSEPEQRLTRHILINFGADRDAALSKATALRSRVAGGEDFAEVAESDSDDPSSSDEGGSLGWVRRGQYDESLEAAIFELPEGALSEPVESAFGYHLVRVDEIRPAQTKPFEDEQVQAQLVDLYRAREGEKRFTDLAEQIEDQSFQHSDSLQAAADAAGLEVKTTDWLSRDARTGVMAYEAVRDAAFSAEVLQDGENSRLLSVSPTRVIVVRKLEYEPARTRPFEEVAERIRSELKMQAARKQAMAAAQAAMSAARADQTLDAVAGEAQASIESPGQVTRTQSGVPPQVLDVLFRMPRPATERPSFETVQLDNGDAILIALDGVAEPDPAAVKQEVRSASRRELSEAAAGAEFMAVMEAVRQSADVTVASAPAPLEAQE